MESIQVIFVAYQFIEDFSILPTKKFHQAFKISQFQLEWTPPPCLQISGDVYCWAPQGDQDFFANLSMGISGTDKNWRYLPYIRPRKKGYVRGYPSKIWPYIQSVYIIGPDFISNESQLKLGGMWSPLICSSASSVERSPLDVKCNDCIG